MTLMLLVSTLQAFIEGSSLGEFHVRLQMLLVFHCHVLLMPQVEGKGKEGGVCVCVFTCTLHCLNGLGFEFSIRGIWLHTRFYLFTYLFRNILFI